MNTKSDELKNLIFITIPDSAARIIEGFSIDPTIEIPVQLPAGTERIESAEEITIELIISGMLKILAWDPGHPHRSYYRDFVLAVQPNAAEELNIAAIAQEQKANFLFAEELFRSVCALTDQSEAFINLATLYSRIAASDEAKGEVYDDNQQKALLTLKAGLDVIEDDPDLLREIGFFHLYQGNVEVARSYLERYLETEGPDDEKRAHTQRIMADIKAKLADDERLMAAYDAIQMNNEIEAIRLLDLFLADNPAVWNAWFLKGWALRRQRNFSDAQVAFLKALSYTEGSSDLYNELAICSLESGQRELAKEYLNTAIDLDEENITLLSNLAYLHLSDGELDEAREYLERCRALDENDPVVIKLMEDYQRDSGEIIGEPIVQEYLATEEVIERMGNSEEV